MSEIHTEIIRHFYNGTYHAITLAKPQASCGHHLMCGHCGTCLACNEWHLTLSCQVAAHCACAQKPDSTNGRFKK